MGKNIERHLFSEILPWLGESKILVIKGARQVGKTTLLWSLLNHLKSKGQSVIFFSVDQERLEPWFSSPAAFLRYLVDQHGFGKSKKRLHIFLDEFQYLTEPGLFLKQLFDQEKDRIQLIVSGSSSLDISKNSEFLTGRKLDFYLHPFSFLEHLKSKSTLRFTAPLSLNHQNELKEFYQLYGSTLHEQWSDYLRWGGYPEVVLRNEVEKKEAVLADIVHTYIEKDVSGFLRVENVSAFNNLVRVLAHQIGQQVNLHELRTTLGLHQETIRKYLDILQGTYVLALLPPFFKNIRKEISKMKKAYMLDLGMNNILVGSTHLAGTHSFTGHVVENAVYLDLLRRFAGRDLYYYRTLGGAEIDFVLAQDGLLLPIEVKYQKGRQPVPVSARHFQERYTQALPPLIITQEDIHVSSTGVFLPAPLLPLVDLSLDQYPQRGSKGSSSI